jgi:uncharacterized repeat protein (TIGR01451 family)
MRIASRNIAAAAAAVLVVFVFGAASAGAASPGAGWMIDSIAVPTNFSVAQGGTYQVLVRNAGSAASEGTITIVDTLPPGLTVTGVGFPGSCETGVGAVRCQYSEAVPVGGNLGLSVSVAVEPGAPETLTNTVSVSGGGGVEVSRSIGNANSARLPSFGFAGFDSFIAGLGGVRDAQAGDHPYEVTTTIDLNSATKIDDYSTGYLASVRYPKDVLEDLPLGFAGSAIAAPECTLAQLSSRAKCPPATQVGHIKTQPQSVTGGVNSPIWNLVPERGVPAEFGFVDSLHTSHVFYVGVVPTPGGYVLQASSLEIPQAIITNIIVTFFGDPAARDGSGNTPLALFTNPSDCSGAPGITTAHMDAWASPGAFNADGSPDLTDPNWVTGTSEAPPVTGCDLLRFSGSLTAQPETTQAATPTGLGVQLKVPLSETPGTLATPTLKKTVLTLPAGLVINPSAAGGLETCSLAQIGLGTNLQPSCPEASKIGTVEVTTPAVATVLQGSVYLAAQNENPFHTLLAGYIVIDDPTRGVLVKVPGRIDPDPTTGQLTVTVDDIPQFPFSDLKLHTFGGPRASLVTPAGCGTFTSGGQLTPWSAPDSGPPTSTVDSFQIASGCPNVFGPSFTGGTVNNQAGSFSPFTTTFSRTDEDQGLSGVSVTTPPGLLGILKGVERCPEPQASQGTCGANSLIGHTTVAAGAGPNPYWVQGGEVFFTGPYKGAPFGLSVVVPAVAGPFNLGNVVVRAAIQVDPHTAQITVVSDPLPTILQGIPLDVRTVNVTIDRPSFMFNPTSCEPFTVGGSLTSTQGATAQVSSRFQAANCANLPFHPVFSVSTQAKTSKHNGASLTVKTTYPTGAQANIRSVAVTLPKQLPSRLTTIQQACTETAFALNPAICPAGSNIGIATASTPILTAPATGAVYLVSHGGAAFPDVVIVFQDEGVTLDLVGSVNIKHGITSSTFASVPDAPISSFQLSLPEGPHSALATVLPAKAKGSLCGTSLSMPFTITGQNGAVLKQNVKIAVTGCGKPKKVKHKQKGSKKKGK